MNSVIHSNPRQTTDSTSALTVPYYYTTYLYSKVYNIMKERVGGFGEETSFCWSSRVFASRCGFLVSRYIVLLRGDIAVSVECLSPVHVFNPNRDPTPSPSVARLV